MELAYQHKFRGKWRKLSLDPAPAVEGYSVAVRAVGAPRILARFRDKRSAVKWLEIQAAYYPTRFRREPSK